MGFFVGLTTFRNANKTEVVIWEQSPYNQLRSVEKGN